MSQRLLIARRAARAAGQVLARKLKIGRRVHIKGVRDIVTDADYAADKTIRKILSSHFPRDLYLSEEASADERKELWARVQASERAALWIVDPLDGTMNYAHHLPPFSVSIALLLANTLQVGVIYDPLHNEMFWAERGHGAYLNGKKIAVSRTCVWADAIVGAEWARAPDLRERMAAVFAQMATPATTARAFGSAALTLGYLAAGRIDAYFHLSLAPWDVAAAALIVEEAGGKLTTPTGAACNIHSEAFLITNGPLHPRALEFFK